MDLVKSNTDKINWGRFRNNKRAQLFVFHWMILKNGTQAAIEAGYEKKSAPVTACKLLKSKIIQKAIEVLERKDVRNLGIDRLEVLRQLYYAMTYQAKDFFSESGRLLDPHELPERVQSVVDGIKQKRHVDPKTGEETYEIEYKCTPHAIAREQAMKHKGLFAPDIVLGALPFDFDRLYNRREDDQTDPVEQAIIDVESKELEDGEEV